MIASKGRLALRGTGYRGMLEVSALTGFNQSLQAKSEYNTLEPGFWEDREVTRHAAHSLAARSSVPSVSGSLSQL